jgi:hypothetical protein
MPPFSLFLVQQFKLPFQKPKMPCPTKRSIRVSLVLEIGEHSNVLNLYLFG